MQKSIVLSHNKDIINSSVQIAAIGVLFFVLATTLGAFVRIPLKNSPVPITLQTFFVLLSGAVLGRKLGGLSQAVYLILGAAGLPIFQSSGFGASYLLGPTGGYLVGFIAASYAVGRLVRFNSFSTMWIIASFAIGSLIIYIFGVSWLGFIYKTGMTKAVYMGALPFIPGDIVKILIAALIYSRISNRSREIFPE